MRKLRQFYVHLIFFALFFCIGAISWGQTQNKTDFNDYYKFPFSVGVTYAEENPLISYGFDIKMTDIYGNFRLPMSFLPSLQLSAKLGIISFQDLRYQVKENLDHTHYFITLGAAWANKFSKDLELAGEIGAGMSLATFPNIEGINPDTAGYKIPSTYNFIASAGLRLSLNLMFNISLDVCPEVKFIRYLGVDLPDDEFLIQNKFLLSFGFSGHFRAGTDPDAPQAVIRSIKFETDTLPSAFSAMQSYYSSNPLGKVKITNTEKFELYDVQVAFYQAGYMDNPSKSPLISELGPGESAEVDVYSLFNDNIFTKNGVTPLVGEVSVDYLWRSKSVRQVSSVSYDLYDKTSLTWDDDRKVGAFITSSDSAIRNYSSAIRNYANEYKVPNFSDTLQAAMQVYYGLNELGVIYQRDPTAAFDDAQKNAMIVDSVSLPRDTLVRLTGDCDDLTVVYCALLEALGIKTAFVTITGHIFMAFNTGVESKDYQLVHPDKNMTISVNGELWVPVEITYLGNKKFSFLEAWRKGIEEFSGAEDNRNLVKTGEAQSTFRPVGLQETDLGLQYGDRDKIVKDFKRDMDKLIDDVLGNYREAAAASNNKRDYNKLGTVAGNYGRLEIAEEAFNKALSLDRNYLNPKLSLGSLYLAKEEYQEALRTFLSAERSMAEEGRTTSSVYSKILLSISMTYYELENYDRVAEYNERIMELAPELLEGENSYLNGSPDGSRAADIGAVNSIIFFDDEE